MKKIKKKEADSNLLLTSIIKELFGNQQIYSSDDFFDNIVDRVIDRLESKKQSESKFYTSKEICKKYRISPATLERRIRKGLEYESSGKKTKRLFTIEAMEKFKGNDR